MITSACRLSVFLIALLLMAAPAAAADLWVVANLRGAVFALVDNQWSELQNGDAVASGVAVRTLQAGRVRLQRKGQAMQLGPNTTIRTSGAGGSVTVEQFAGTLSFGEPAGGGYRLVAPGLVATISGASVVSRVGGARATLAVRQGRVPVVARGRHLVVLAGQTVSLGAGTAPSVSGASTAAAGSLPSPPAGPAAALPPGPAAAPPAGLAPSPPAAPGAGTIPSAGPAPGPGKSDNGVGNGGTPGNGGPNGGAGGNGKSPGSGNAGK